MALYGRICGRCGAAVPVGDLVERVAEVGAVRTVEVLCLRCAGYAPLLTLEERLRPDGTVELVVREVPQRCPACGWENA